MYRFINLVFLLTLVLSGCKPANNKDPVNMLFNSTTSKAPIKKENSELVESALLFTGRLYKGDYEHLITMLTPEFVSSTTIKKLSLTIEQLYISHGRPKSCNFMGVTIGEMQVPDRVIPIKSILLRCKFLKPDGKEEAGIANITYELSNTEQSLGVVSFKFILQSDMKYLGKSQ